MELTPHDPIALFEAWYQQAQQQETTDPDVMALATATSDGRPSVRMVLYKGIAQGGFLVFTNYHSRKGQELAQNPQAAVVFYWPKAYRQVRIEGRMELLTHDESAAYFASRPRGSQIAASISPQSKPVEDREHLLDDFRRFESVHADQKIDCPAHWGGYRLIPASIEFWQGQEHRLHDRLLFTLRNQTWEMQRLAP